MGESILITGISGIGKSTVAKNLSINLNIPHICVGKLLEKLAKERYGLDSRDEIKNIPLDKILLLHGEGKKQILKLIKLNRFVVLDDHLAPLSQGGKKIKLLDDYITTYSIKAVFFLTSPSNLIRERINNDKIKRKRHKFSKKKIVNNSKELWLLASQIAKKSDIPIHKIENIDVGDTIRIIFQYIQELGVDFI